MRSGPLNDLFANRVAKLVEETKIQLDPIHENEIEKANRLIKEKHPLINTDIFTALPYISPLRPYAPNIREWWNRRGQEEENRQALLQDDEQTHEERKAMLADELLEFVEKDE